MTNSKIKIKDLEFNEKTPSELSNDNFYCDWPVVYILNNDKQMYIGETYHSPERMKQHLKNPIRKSLKEAHIIGCNDFTKSATLDIESSLIELCSSIEKGRTLQNECNGIVKHNYSNKEEFAQDSTFFSHLWKQLQDRGLVKGSIENLKNSDIFKLSPYKSLNAEQCTTRDYIVEEVLESINKNENRSIFVNGSAGTGKTILAIYLMKLFVTNANYLNDDDISETLPFINDLKKIREKKPNLEIAYVVSMTSFRNTLKEVFKQVKGLKPSMVIGPSEVVKQKYDILIVDEAHRLKKRKNLSAGGDYHTFDVVNETLGLRCQKDEKDGNQLDWILKQSQIQILFYDSTQSIKPTDIDEAFFNKIKKFSSYHNLTSQMRCKGGMEYITYIKNVLNQKQDMFEQFNEKYELLLFDDINEFCEKVLQRENEVGLSRVVSGYGFKWISKPGTKNKSNKHVNDYDIVINGKGFFWNKKDKKWPTSIGGKRVIEEAGCIHTIQGYDLNYCGVIMGPEIVFNNGTIEIDKGHYYDATGKIGIDDETLKEYILNIYSVLLTRGIKGTYLYVCDDALREYLLKYISRYNVEVRND